MESRSRRSTLYLQRRLPRLVEYWRTGYSWRCFEAQINALPLLLTRGWLGSILELLEAIDPLTHPAAHGGRASDAFHVIVPSLPGYAFCDEPFGYEWLLGGHIEDETPDEMQRRYTAQFSDG